jgi:hypothetical protein
MKVSVPNYIGWIGGRPVMLKNGEMLAVAFSGFRGETDLQLIADAVRNIENE